MTYHGAVLLAQCRPAVPADKCSLKTRPPIMTRAGPLRRAEPQPRCGYSPVAQVMCPPPAAAPSGWNAWVAAEEAHRLPVVPRPARWALEAAEEAMEQPITAAPFPAVTRMRLAAEGQPVL